MAYAKLYTAFGETKTAEEWSKDSRCRASLIALRARFNRKILPEEALTRPMKYHLIAGEKFINKVYDTVQILKVYKSVKHNENKHNKYFRMCKCKCLQIHNNKTCGNIFEARFRRVVSNKLKSCGCALEHVSGENGHHWQGCGEINNTYFNSIKTGAESRCIEFDITLQQLWNLFLKQNRRCALSGIELIFRKPNTPPKTQTASLDRIDSSKGYTINNIQWVHKTLNRIKWHLTEIEFIDWCHKVSDYNRSRINTLCGN